jgi:hypothetical protein
MKIPHTMDHWAPSCMDGTDLLNPQMLQVSSFVDKETMAPLTLHSPWSLTPHINSVQIPWAVKI